MLLNIYLVHVSRNTVEAPALVTKIYYFAILCVLPFSYNQKIEVLNLDWTLAVASSISISKKTEACQDVQGRPGHLGMRHEWVSPSIRDVLGRPG